MAKLTRRDFIGAGLGVSVALASSFPAFAAKAGVNFKVGVTDWNLKQEGKIELSPLPRTGFRWSTGQHRPWKRQASPFRSGLAASFPGRVPRVNLPIESLCLEILHHNYLKSDPLGQRWVADAIPIAKAMNVRVILLPFFGKGALTNVEEMDKVGDALKEVAPAAERSGVVLGLEDTISARDNVRIMERTKSPAVLTYYDVGNSSKGGFNVVEEIRWLGGARICEVHLKDNPHYLGEGPIDFKAVIDALADVGFKGWAQLETDSPASLEADMQRNLKFIRGLLAARNAGKTV